MQNSKPASMWTPLSLIKRESLVEFTSSQQKVEGGAEPRVCVLIEERNNHKKLLNAIPTHTRVRTFSKGRYEKWAWYFHASTEMPAGRAKVAAARG